jgi:hypothetical protein
MRRPRRRPACWAGSTLRSRQAVVLLLRPLWSVPIQERRHRLVHQQAYRVGPGDDRPAGVALQPLRNQLGKA